MSDCVFCGAPARVPVVFLDTFTAYQLLQAGDSACSICAMMLRDAKFRRNCWFLVGEVWAKLDDVLEFLDYKLPAILLELAASPDLKSTRVVVYLTLQKRKHGWILAVQNPVLSPNRFVLVVDEEKILFERGHFTELLQLCRELFFTRELPKWLLLGGYPAPSVIRRFDLSSEVCSKLHSLQRDRLWWAVVSFCRREKV